VITIRFSRGDGLLGGLVRAVTWSDFAHVGFKLHGGHVLDATPQFGVADRVAADDAATRYFAVEAPDALVAQAVDWAWSQIGQPYDWSGALGVGLHRDWHGSGRWDCAELVWQAFKVAGLELVRADHLDRVTPATLLLSPYLRRLPAAALDPGSGFGGAWVAGH